jgi:hypothetical protein
MTSIKLIYSVMFYLRVRVDRGVMKQKKIELNRLLGGQKGFFLIDNSHYLDESKYLYHRLLFELLHAHVVGKLNTRMS